MIERKIYCKCQEKQISSSFRNIIYVLCAEKHQNNKLIERKIYQLIPWYNRYNKAKVPNFQCVPITLEFNELLFGKTRKFNYNRQEAYSRGKVLCSDSISNKICILIERIYMKEFF